MNNEYLRRGQLRVKLFGRGLAWLDTGTHENLLAAANFVQIVQKRQGLYIACLEGDIHRMGYINARSFSHWRSPCLKRTTASISEGSRRRKYEKEFLLRAARASSAPTSCSTSCGKKQDIELLVNLDLLTYAGNLENLLPVQDDKRYRFVHGDIRDKQLVEDIFAKYEFDTVVHFAAESHVDRSILERSFSSPRTSSARRRFWTPPSGTGSSPRMTSIRASIRTASFISRSRPMRYTAR